LTKASNFVATRQVVTLPHQVLEAESEEESTEEEGEDEDKGGNQEKGDGQAGGYEGTVWHCGQGCPGLAALLSARASHWARAELRPPYAGVCPNAVDPVTFCGATTHTERSHKNLNLFVCQ